MYHGGYLDWLSFMEHPAWDWLAISVLLLIVEMVIIQTEVVLVPMAIATAVTGALLFIDPLMPLEMRSAAGMIIASLYVVTLKITMRGRATKSPSGFHLVNRLIGREAVLQEPIRDGIGFVTIDGIRWRVRCPVAIAGTRIRVTAREGNLLVTDPIPDPPQQALVSLERTSG